LPTWKANLLNKAGRTVLVKSKLSAIPIHTAIAVEISPWVIKCIDKRRRSFLWNGSANARGGCSAIAWPKACRPPDLGGLGILHLKIFGYALRLRWLWLEKTDNLRPWSCLPVKHENIVMAMFEDSLSVAVGDGNSALFWKDRWLQGKCIEEIAPCLFNAVRPRVCATRTVAQGCSQRSWVQDISGALTVQVILDYLLLWDLIEATQLTHGVQDKFLWKWTADNIFTTASAYRDFFIGLSSIAGAKTLWKTRAPGKCKFFGWLALRDRCWTAERRKRHGLQQDDTCMLCNQEVESISHLLVGCSFSRQVWYNFLHRIGCSYVTPCPSSVLADWWMAAQKRFAKLERHCFDSLVVLIFWIIWNERNRRIFYRKARLVEDINALVIEDVGAWFQAGFKTLTPCLQLLRLSPGRTLTNM
jgi:hypothetical protein